ncbi:phosphatase PAP2 family protein [Patescibacteria group bacterium]|nr:MAG: phosphatase PAP2 family protein [Patescibacteria group bacterium]
MTTELAQPKNILDRVAIWCATYLIFVILCLGLLLSRYTGLLLLILPVFLAWLFAFLLQLAFHRRRPFQNGEKALIKMLWETPSFPSAHTAIASAIAYVYLFDGEPFAPLFVLSAVLMAWSRVRVRVHYPTDTLVGALVGFLAVYAAVWILLSTGIID